MANPNIRFPILRRLVLKNYGLFPGEDGNGIDHRFEPGVTVIPGVNGLGKTTLLNIIYRLLVGPFDPYKGDEIQLTQRRLKELRFFNYFSKRDKGASTEGIALGEFDFGDKKITVERTLNDLAITTLRVDETDLLTNEGNPEDEIWQLAGCSSQYDFHLVVRSVLFFLEEKTPVVWDPVAQAEIFRIIFLKADAALELANMAAKIQATDSNARNMYDQLRRYKDQLFSMQARSSAATEVSKRTKFLQRRLPEIDKQIERLSETTEKLESMRDMNRAKLDALKLDLEEATRHLEFNQHKYFASLFPGLTETAKNVLTNLVGENGCLVCGSRRSGLSEQLRLLAKEGVCPVCHSPKEDQEPTITAAQFGSKTIQRETAKVEKLRSEVNRSQEVVNSTDETYRKELSDLFEIMAERDKLLAEVDQIGAMLPVSETDLSETESYIEFTEREIKKLKRRNKVLLGRYTQKLSALTKEVKRHRSNLANFFTQYAGSFLAESCKLTFAPQDLRLGQAIEMVEYPTFAVQMTSAVTPSTGTTRRKEDDVSESQKEFIDLAFRMAVIKAYATSTNTTAGAMLVIETPESSLDSVFIGNAGEMLRNWCADPTPGLNSVIATSNLNRENMIAALLGLNKRPKPSKTVIKKHIVNLLELAAENATLRQHRRDYERQFEESTTLKYEHKRN